MKKERKVWAMTLIAFWWLAPNLLQAQQDSVRSTDLDAVVVTATKYPKNISETGKVLTVIDEAQLSRSTGKDLSQLLNEQVGLVVSGANSNPGKDKSLYLRGAGSGYTLILLDGIPVNDPSGVGGVFDPRLLPIDQIERVEILKGSQSTLYGTDAIAGVINIITKKKGLKPFGGSAALSYGSYNTLKGNINAAGNTSKVSYSIGYTRYSTDGISEAKDLSGTGGFDNDPASQNAFQANTSFLLGKSLTLQPYVRYNTFDGKFDDGPDADSKVNEYNSNLLNAGLQAQYELSKGSVHFLYGFDKTDRTFDFGAGSVFKYFGRFQHGEAFWKTDLTGSLRLLTGVSYQFLKMLDDTATEKDPDVTITSPYASLFLSNVKGLSVELGGRLNAHSRYGNNFTYSFNPSYLIKQRTKIFLNVSTGFKAPTLSQLYGAFGSNPDLKPEHSQSWEGGVQFFSADKKLDLRVSAFGRDVKDVIYAAFGVPTVNLNQQNDSGVEVELAGRIGSSLSVKAFYAYVDGYFKDASSGAAISTYNLIRRPRNSFGLNLGYQVSPAFYVSCNLKTFGVRSDIYFPPPTFAPQGVNLDAYALLDAYFEYTLANKKLKIFVDAKNLLNQDYMEVYGYNTLKFNVMSGLNFSF